MKLLWVYGMPVCGCTSAGGWSHFSQGGGTVLVHMQHPVWLLEVAGTAKTTPLATVSIHQLNHVRVASPT